jgi:hypothetical protein
MNRTTITTRAMQSATNTSRDSYKRALLIAAAVLTVIVPVIAQMGGDIGGRTAGENSSCEAGDCRKSAETAPVSMDGNNPAYAQR